MTFPKLAAANPAWDGRSLWGGSPESREASRPRMRRPEPPRGRGRPPHLVRHERIVAAAPFRSPSGVSHFAPGDYGL
jgi:hypothetical protein